MASTSVRHMVRLYSSWIPSMMSFSLQVSGGNESRRASHVSIRSAIDTLEGMWEAFGFSVVVYVYFVVSLLVSIHLVWQLIPGLLPPAPHLQLYPVLLLAQLVLALLRGAVFSGTSSIRAWLIASGKVRHCSSIRIEARPMLTQNPNV